jgi:hypothetical protein
MLHKNRITLILLFVLTSILIDSAHAWPFRRARRIRSGGVKQVAPKYDEASGDYRSLRAYYDYSRASAPEAALCDRIRVFLSVQDENVLSAKEQIVAEVKIRDLSDHEKNYVRYCPVSFTGVAQKGSKIGVFELTNENEESPIVESAKVYRLFVNLHRKSKEYGKDSALGRVALPYYVATSGETRIDRARQHIVMRTFKEFYYARRGWRSGERYPMDCYAFYMWATGSCTVGAQNGRTILGRLFGGRTPYNNGSDVRELAKKGQIHGDYVRIPGHSFMLLAYDPKIQKVWTIEGNFSRTIEVVNRSLGSGWTVGHLAEHHIRPELFDATAVADSEPRSSTTVASHSRNAASS